MTTISLSLKGLGKVFETDAMETHALKNVDLEIEKGEYVAVSGPSGCGKSTLLTILGLLDNPSRGEYVLDGENVASLCRDRAAEIRNSKIGFVFQSFNLIDELSVKDNILLPFKYSASKPSNEKLNEKVDEILAKVGLEHRKDHKSNLLSGGQQQRVAIARAIVNDPSLLLIDEATGNLDSENSQQIMDLIESLNEAGTTILMVTHDPVCAARAKRTLKMKDGMLIS
ncbi:ABC transporter ATP-binding protein [Pseudoalteromonas luteoviolacea]|uniref:ABC transporter ATP-binding protein n=1 Tax=Pseudoalteromonas luteoviolacea TaxID=43657 RepID=UPI001F3881A7|nr:ABC transporter ATP-binding protein [Pseudoalteromonas luteoviolacea]MCF6442194.1 ABC transporter ATP-binding protein [Pseudoalteromonas luteoviolacea]